MTAQKRKIFRIALIFMLCLCAFASPAYAKTKSKKTKVYKIKTAADWKNISKKNGGSFKLTKDIRLSSTKQYLIINKNKKYTIDLNGHKVYTTYAGAVSRTTCPLEIKKGTVILKSSKKNKGVLYSTETSAVTVEGKAKFYLKSGAIVNDAVEFRSDVIHGLCLTDSAKGYIQNDAKIMSIGSGIIMMGKSRLYTSGHPFIRAGVSTLTGMSNEHQRPSRLKSPMLARVPSLSPTRNLALPTSTSWDVCISKSVPFMPKWSQYVSSIIERSFCVPVAIPIPFQLSTVVEAHSVTPPV